MPALDWLHTHAQDIFAALGAAYMAALLIVKITPTPRDDAALERVNVFLRALARVFGLDLKQGFASKRKPKVGDPIRGRPGERGRVPVLGLVILVGAFLLCSCVTVHQRDPVTIAEIEAAIAAEEAYAARVQEELAEAGVPERDRLGIKDRSDARLVRLRKWLAYEQAKRGGEAPK